MLKPVETAVALSEVLRLDPLTESISHGVSAARFIPRLWIIGDGALDTGANGVEQRSSGAHPDLPRICGEALLQEAHLAERQSPLLADRAWSCVNLLH